MEEKNTKKTDEKVDAPNSTSGGEAVENTAQAKTLSKKEIDDQFLSTAMKTKAAHDKEPRVKLLVPLKQGEPEGVNLDVTINGYRYSIPKNVVVDLPESVAQIVADSEKLTLEAGASLKLARSQEVEAALQ